MKTTVRRFPAAPIALAATLLTAVLVFFAPLSASAHDALIGASPAADSSVETLPAELTLTFNAQLIDGEGATEVVVTDAAGASVTDGAATVDGSVVNQPLVAEADAGQYHVIRKIVSSDGHPTSGEFFFTVNTGSRSATATAEPSATPTSSATAEASAAPEPTASPAPDTAAEDGMPAWAWVLIGAGVLATAAAAVWGTARARGKGGATGSDDPASR